MPTLNSKSIGNPEQFLDFHTLCQALAELPPPPEEAGSVALLISRTAGGRRELPPRVRLTPEQGMPGDAWGRHARPHMEAQLAVMQVDIARLVANGQPIELAGDNLFLDLDLSAANLPIGSRLRIGDALLEVTPMEHNGCSKFRARFGADALRFVNDAEMRPRNLRGIYLRVIEAGEVAVNEPATVVSRTRA